MVLPWGEIQAGRTTRTDPASSHHHHAMTAIHYLKLAVTRPNDLKTLIQYWIWHEKKRDITAMQEHPTSGWNRASMRKCWEFLDMTSRSFAAVIKELDGDLARVVRTSSSSPCPPS